MSYKPSFSNAVEPDLFHRTQVDNAISFGRYTQHLIQDLFYVQLLALSIIKTVHYG